MRVRRCWPGWWAARGRGPCALHREGAGGEGRLGALSGKLAADEDTTSSREAGSQYKGALPQCDPMLPICNVCVDFGLLWAAP